MNPDKLSEKSRDSNTVNPLDAIRVLRSAGGALIDQLALHGQLVHIQFKEEKIRLLKMFIVTLMGLGCLLCLMLFVGIFVLAFYWNTEYRIPAAILLIAIYALGCGVAWFRLKTLLALGDQAFASTREELAADIAMLKSRL
jgi:uncharacterized membrane protein YqjE